MCFSVTQSVYQSTGELGTFFFGLASGLSYFSKVSSEVFLFIHFITLILDALASDET